MRLAEATINERPPAPAERLSVRGEAPAPLDRRPAGGGRLLADLSPGVSTVTLAEHRRRYPAPPAPRRPGWAELIGLIGRSGLTGRGGGAFLVARKLHAVAQGRAAPVVVVNGAEGEPASGKDRLLLTRLPHLVLDGALLAAAAVGGDRVEVCIDRTHTSALAALRHAVAERTAQRETSVAIHVTATPPRYVAGESSALVNFLNDGPAKPTSSPPLTAEKGVAGRPTLVNNAETLAHLAQIANFGPDWFRQAGTTAEPGTMLLTVSGAVAQPAVVEAAIGTPIGEILARAGGVEGSPEALLVGGFFGTWVAFPTALDAPFSRAGLAPFGAQPGAGVIIVLPGGSCGLAETARILAWYAAESAGQCGPCLYGLADLAAGAAALAHGAAAANQVAQLRHWAAQIEGRGACHHPDGAVNLLRSALWVFARDLDRHELGGGCPGSAAPPAIAVPATHTTWR
ncbi:MAG TPA: NADH-ubiquinone oxidoreductase-F iron-sulfur binding region domain-containing protein [Acidimicrobiales bacterium]|jgi:NADH:ubiquinone oxidoreductase subunit F (NADH-binding)|nr:NADH-ubiquinone oxidoreductase-F iron-sulfur binding region domain-containing protein [Acidimicrobiales bacterium]